MVPNPITSLLRQEPKKSLLCVTSSGTATRLLEEGVTSLSNCEKKSLYRKLFLRLFYGSLTHIHKQTGHGKSRLQHSNLVPVSSLCCLFSWWLCLYHASKHCCWFLPSTDPSWAAALTVQVWASLLCLALMYYEQHCVRCGLKSALTSTACYITWNNP